MEVKEVFLENPIYLYIYITLYMCMYLHSATTVE